jgi:hypothetical protein
MSAVCLAAPPAPLLARRVAAVLVLVAVGLSPAVASGHASAVPSAKPIVLKDKPIVLTAKPIVLTAKPIVL